MKAAHIASLFALTAAACGKSTPTYSVGGHSLTVRDSGYVTTDGYFCSGAAAGQLKLNIVDYDPICGGAVPASADGGARDPQLEHNELELIFVLSAHTEGPKVPYEVTPPNCDIGPAGPGIAYFKHYPSGSTTPDVKIAQSGELYLSKYDSTDQTPAIGKFKLDFGGLDQVEGEFETYTCN